MTGEAGLTTGEATFTGEAGFGVGEATLTGDFGATLTGEAGFGTVSLTGDFGATLTGDAVDAGAGRGAAVFLGEAGATTGDAVAAFTGDFGASWVIENYCFEEGGLSSQGLKKLKTSPPSVTQIKCIDN